MLKYGSILFRPPQCFLRPPLVFLHTPPPSVFYAPPPSPVTNFMLLYSSFLCNEIARARLRGRKKYKPNKLVVGGGGGGGKTE